MKIKTSRSRAVAAALTGMALIGGGAAVTTQAANAAPPAEDCKQAYPVADLLAGDAVTGLTVDTGTVPEGFTGEILGVLNNGIAPGLPMIMARLTSDEIDRVGIWQGMSGSPVYAEDGSLIGAVSYGLTWGPSPVAGITPYEDMAEYMDTTPPLKVTVGPRLAKRIAAETDVTARQARQGMEQLPMPLSFSGISKRRLNQMQGKNGPDFIKTRGATATGASSSAVDAGPEDLVAGGNLGAVISYGDITFGGVGTVTSVCNNRLVGFGHPLGFFGKTTLGLMPAEALYVQEDPAAPGFKVANMGEVPAGMIDQDRLTGISGPVGDAFLPPETDVTSTVTYGTKEEGFNSHSLIKDFNADITFSQVLANHDRVIDAYQPGSEDAEFTITGTDANANQFEIGWSDTYVSSYDISYESSYEIAEAVYVLSRMKGVKVDSVVATADVVDSTAVLRLKTVQQKRGAKWVTIGRKKPVLVTPGSTLHLRAQVTGGGTTKWVPITVAVPAKVTRNGFLEVSGGLSSWDNGLFGTKTPAQLKSAIAAMTKNDEVKASLAFFKRGKDLVRQSKSAAQAKPVRGRVWAEVQVKR